jgi:hypothetical protein
VPRYLYRGSLTGGHASYRYHKLWLEFMPWMELLGLRFGAVPAGCNRDMGCAIAAYRHLQR